MQVRLMYSGYLSSSHHTHSDIETKEAGLLGVLEVNVRVEVERDDAVLERFRISRIRLQTRGHVARDRCRVESHLETTEHAAATTHLKLTEELQALAQFTKIAHGQVVLRLNRHVGSAELMLLLLSLIISSPVHVTETHAGHHWLKYIKELR